MTAPRPRTRATGALALAGILAAALVPSGCEGAKRQAAADAYSRELSAHRARFQEFQERYPGIEKRLGEARQKAPDDVVRLVEREMLPLLDKLARGFTPMIRAGRAYVERLPDSVKARKDLQRQLGVFGRQQRLMRQIHRSYVDEAALFRKGRPDQAALQDVFARRLRAARRMQTSAGE